MLKNDKTTNIFFRASPEVRDKLHTLAESEFRNITGYLCNLITREYAAYLKTHKDEQK